MLQPHAMGKGSADPGPDFHDINSRLNLSLQFVRRPIQCEQRDNDRACHVKVLGSALDVKRGGRIKPGMVARISLSRYRDIGISQPVNTSANPQGVNGGAVHKRRAEADRNNTRREITERPPKKPVAGSLLESVASSKQKTTPKGQTLGVVYAPTNCALA